MNPPVAPGTGHVGRFLFNRVRIWPSLLQYWMYANGYSQAGERVPGHSSCLPGAGPVAGSVAGRIGGSHVLFWPVFSLSIRSRGRLTQKQCQAGHCGCFTRKNRCGMRVGELVITAALGKAEKINEVTPFSGPDYPCPGDTWEKPPGDCGFGPVRMVCGLVKPSTCLNHSVAACFHSSRWWNRSNHGI